MENLGKFSKKVGQEMNWEKRMGRNGEYRRKQTYANDAGTTEQMNRQPTKLGGRRTAAGGRRKADGKGERRMTDDG